MKNATKAAEAVIDTLRTAGLLLEKDTVDLLLSCRA